ncbi:type VI secretion system baseplate subunit TssF [Marinomonas balearica]|uniref:Type VI secretion system protein ImpG n=1 Tax=Marinomonas balearica TaxID=491947 RepID=A0A4R6M4U0_9GAMM|nr:type VI secretion system baseplate subunit TssF [Marinomonas balearica]TDO95530.1 type VI secretion system protein ImpG [Marinomonas balearica]
MKEYFEAELRLLKEESQEFAKAYPEQAAMLSLSAVRDRDPYVERLLEGMAFLTSKIRERLDDSVPELSQSLLDQLAPSLCRPFPSHLVLEFSSSNVSNSVVGLPKGTVISSQYKGPDDIKCHFQTTSDIELVPFQIQDIKATDVLGRGTKLVIELEKNVGVAWADIQVKRLPMFLNCDRSLAYVLYEALTNATAMYGLEINDRQGDAAISASRLSIDANTLPSYEQGHAAYNILFDYFNARDRFMFIELTNLDYSLLEDSAQRLTVTIQTDVFLPSTHKVDRQTFRLNSVSGINTFPAEAEPIKACSKLPDFLVSVDRECGSQASAYWISEVASRDLKTGSVTEYKSLHKLDYRSEQDSTFMAQLKRSSTGKWQHYISLAGPQNMDEQTLSIGLTATNNNYPRKYLDVGDVCELPPEIEQSVSVRNISRPSKVMEPPSNHDFGWQLVSMLSQNLTLLDSANKLRALLGLFDWSGLEENKNRILGIDGLTQTRQQRVKKGILFNIICFELTVSEAGFSSSADVYFFGSVLHAFFSAYADISERIETKITAVPSNKEWFWEASLCIES